MKRANRKKLIPNQTTIQAIEEVKEMEKNKKKYKRYRSFDDLLQDVQRG